MKIAMDLQPCIGNKTGIGMYTHEIAKRLKSDEQISYQGEVFDFLGREGSKQLRSEYSFPVQVCKQLPFGIQRRVRNIVPLPHEFYFDKADLHHFPYSIVPPHISGKVITTIHDLTYLHYPETMAQKTYDYLKSGIEYSVQRSDYIITDAEAMREEIIEFLGVSPNRVIAIHIAASITEDEAPMREVRQKFGIKDMPYILYLGTIEPRKNLERLIQAYNLMRDDTGCEQQLVLAGGKGWNCQSIYEEAARSPYTEDIIFTDYISSAEKTALYKHAQIFTFPSIYEGFGIPLLEAMHFKVPVLTANVSAMPEVTGSAAELVNPFDVEHIAHGMHCILTDTEYRDKLVQLGMERKDFFGWDKVATKVQQIHRNFL
ncbi:MAG: glycosyltransferase family 1 protein [Lachnospiraceae bacterium]